MSLLFLSDLDLEEQPRNALHPRLPCLCCAYRMRLSFASSSSSLKRYICGQSRLSRRYVRPAAASLCSSTRLLALLIDSAAASSIVVIPSRKQLSRYMRAMATKVEPGASRPGPCRTFASKLARHASNDALIDMNALLEIQCASARLGSVTDKRQSFHLAPGRAQDWLGSPQRTDRGFSGSVYALTFTIGSSRTSFKL